MRAARIVAPHDVIIEHVGIPDPGPMDIRFRVEGCGVCASNVGPWEGLPWLKYPLGQGEGGHEAWGAVDAIGRATKDIRIGDRIAAISYSAYAEYDVAPESAVVKLPDELSRSAFPGEALGCAVNVFERAQIVAGQDVAVVGTGFIGALVTRLASNAGARVIAISRRISSLGIARLMGASECVLMQNHAEVIETMRSLTSDGLCDVVVEATGKQWPLDIASEITKTRGRLVVAGYHQDGARTVNMQSWNWRGIDVVNAHERDTALYVQGMRAALKAVLSRRLDPTPLYTHAYRLEDLGIALQATSEKPDGLVKALVFP